MQWSWNHWTKKICTIFITLLHQGFYANFFSVMPPKFPQFFYDCFIANSFSYCNSHCSFIIFRFLLISHCTHFSVPDRHGHRKSLHEAWSMLLSSMQCIIHSAVRKRNDRGSKRFVSTCERGCLKPSHMPSSEQDSLELSPSNHLLGWQQQTKTAQFRHWKRQ